MTPSVARRRRRPLAVTGRLLSALAVAVAGALAAVGPATPAVAATTTIVSLTFDDGQSSHINTLPILQGHGMTGTFYINSGFVGQGGYYMTWPQIAQLAAAGNEIGGHTSFHSDLTTLPPTEMTAAVCDDRVELQAQGYNPVSFAYPYANSNAAAEQAVAQCGYRSARSVGGWVIITFHGVCDNACTGTTSTTLADFSAFLDLLAARAGNGTVVQNVGSVIAGVLPPPPPPNNPPATAISCNAAACATTTYYTTDGSDPTTSATRTPYAGAFQLASTGTVRYYSRDVGGHDETPISRTVTVATAPASNLAPTTSAACKGSTCSTGWYRSGVPATLSATDPEADALTTRYTTDGSDPVTSAARRSYAGTFTVGRTSTVRFYFRDTGGHAETPHTMRLEVDAAGPRVAICSPSPGSRLTVDQQVYVKVRAVDLGTGGGAASGISRVVLYRGSILVATSRRPVPGTTTYRLAWTPRVLGSRFLHAVAYDAAGNRTRSLSVQGTVTR